MTDFTGRKTPPDTTPSDLADRGHPHLSLIVVGDDYFATHNLPESGRVSVGRSNTCDVCIDDPSVSRVHIILHVGETLRVEDQNSVNGTRVRERALESNEPVEISPDEVVRLGAVSLIVQRRYAPPRARRLWTHEYFEARLEEECARGERKEIEFAVLHVGFPETVASRVPHEIFAAQLRTLDIVSSFGPGHYEVLLLDTTSEDSDQVTARLREAFASRTVDAEIGSARYPLDGRSPDALAAAARRTGSQESGDGEALWGEFIVNDEKMRELHRLVARVARGEISVLLMGETGVGKEILAESIHRHSPRSGNGFLRLNCAALSESLLESELFGHQKGSFTGATASKPGLLETAAGGTVFLDEIGELPLTIQVKLLRVLEERKVLRVGGLTPTSIDVRFVAATNRDLEADIVRGGFREDLYYRLNGISIVIPPLRERPGEIEPLARKFIRQVSKDRVPTLSTEALDLMRSYGWPGNIRELRNVIERAALLCTGSEILPRHMPVEKMMSSFATTQPIAVDPSLASQPAPRWQSSQQNVGSSSSKSEGKSNSEGKPNAAHQQRDGLYGKTDKLSVVAALEQTGGNQTKAAKILGISRRTLVNRLDEFGLPRPRKGRIKR